MAAGNLDDPLSEIPNVVLVDQSAATAAPGAGYVRVEAVNGVLGIRVGSGAWVPLVALAAGLLSSLTEKETPASGDWLLLQDTADSDELKKVDLANLPAGEGGGGLYDAYVCVQDQAAQNTGGGTFTAGDWRQRDLNTELADTAGIASLAANAITLPAGTYDVDISCPAYNVGYHQARLYDTTGAAVLLTGTSEYNGVNGDAQTRSIIRGTITLSVESTLRIDHRCSNTMSTVGFGVACNFGTEVYTSLTFRRVAA